MAVQMIKIAHDTVGVDTPADVERVREILSARPEVAAEASR